MRLILLVSLLLWSSLTFGASLDSLRTKVVCEEGYKFLVVISTNTGTPSVVQIYKDITKVNGYDTHRPPQPMKCKGVNK